MDDFPLEELQGKSKGVWCGGGGGRARHEDTVYHSRSLDVKEWTIFSLKNVHGKSKGGVVAEGAVEGKGQAWGHRLPF